MRKHIDKWTLALIAYESDKYLELPIGAEVAVRYDIPFVNSSFYGRVGFVTEKSGTWDIDYLVDFMDGSMVTLRAEHLVMLDKSMFSEIEDDKKEDNKMKPTGFKKTAKIFVNDKNDRPSYYALCDNDIKKGDKVLVTDITGAASGRIHTVEDVVSAETALLANEQPLCAEVICKVDTSAYDARIKQREHKANLRKLMEATVAQMDEVDKFRVYADHNPEMAKLLAQYSEINV